MNHHTNGVIIGPGATGACDFPGVDLENFIVALPGKPGLELTIWYRSVEGGLRIYALNQTKEAVLFIPMVKDGR